MRATYGRCDEWHKLTPCHRFPPVKLTADDAASLVRCSPGEDATNGFFVSLFVRQDAALSEGDGEDSSNIGKRKDRDDGERQPVAKRRRKKKKPKKALSDVP